MGGRDVDLATFLGARDAEKPDDVGVVGVEELGRVGSVDAAHAVQVSVNGLECWLFGTSGQPDYVGLRGTIPHFVNLRGILAKVFDVAKDVALSILRDTVANVRAKAHGSHS